MLSLDYPDSLHSNPVLLSFSPQKWCFYPENSTIFAQFLWFFRDLKKFCGLFSLSGGIRVWYLIVFFYIFYYIIIYYIPIYFYLFLSNILLFQQYTKIKNRFLLNSLILPQKIEIITKSRNFLLNLKHFWGFFLNTYSQISTILRDRKGIHGVLCPDSNTRSQIATNPFLHQSINYFQESFLYLC